MAVKIQKKRKLGARQQRIVDAHKARMAKTKPVAAPKPRALNLSVVRAIEEVDPGWTQKTYGRSLTSILKSTKGDPTANTMARVAPGGIFDRDLHALKS